MTRYHYKATDGAGRARTGSIEAGSIAEAEATLAARGLTGADVTPDRGDHRPLGSAEVAELLDRLLALTRAGTPLPGGLRAASGEVASPPLRATFAALADALERGRGLDEALVDAAGRFPAHLQGLVRAGVRTGRLADVLAELVQAANLGQELRRQLRVALAYPSVLLVIVTGLTLFICHASSRVVDTVDWAFADFEQPASLLVTVAINRFIAAYDGWIALVLAAAGALGTLAWRRVLSPSQRAEWLGSVPLYGPLIRATSMAEFCHLAALLVEADLPLPAAIDLAGGSVRDPALASTCGRVAEGVAAGESLTASLRRWAGLPASLGQLLAWGEGQGELAGALRFAGDMFEARAEAQATFAARAASAILLILILWWIGFAIASVYLPMVSAMYLISKLAG